MNYNKIPILKSLQTYAEEDLAYFHMPGHKGGNVFKKVGLSAFDLGLLSMDVTEVPGIDNLHCPEAAIAEAQGLAAKAFGAEYSFLLVNGTTGGIYSMILAATNPGDKIIIPRNCHRSVIGAVILGRLMPIYINPEIDKKLGTASGISPETVQQTIMQHPDAKAIVITSPTFYGVCSDLERIADIAHQNNMLLLVDEAHGSHFAFHPKLPKTALQCGADMTAQSTHKTLPAMTQGSMLHVKSDRVDIDKLKFFLQLTQTTSPSHILLATIDIARYIMQEKGEELLEDIIYWCQWLRNELKDTGIYCPGTGDIGRDGIFDIDSTRITLNFSKIGISGTAADELLRSKFKLQVEMADLYNIVAICTVGDSGDNVQRLSHSVRAIAEEFSNCMEKIKGEPIEAFCHIPDIGLLPWEAVHRSKEDIAADQCIGRISAEMIVPYPPGIPIIMPGEIITRQVIDYAQRCRNMGIKINGTKDPSLGRIMVVK